MGMFDTIVAADGGDWQTKAYDCVLSRYRIGDRLGAGSYQVGVLGGEAPGEYVRSFATILDGRVATVPDERRPDLALLDYGGGWLEYPDDSDADDA